MSLMSKVRAGRTRVCVPLSKLHEKRIIPDFDKTNTHSSISALSYLFENLDFFTSTSV